MIGIVSQYFPDDLREKYGKYKSYIREDGVLLLEGSGARVIPIMDTESDEETMRKLSLVNGVLFPGGHPERGYKAKAEFIYQ